MFDKVSLSFRTAFSLSDAASISEGELSGQLIIEHVPGIETEGEKNPSSSLSLASCLPLNFKFVLLVYTLQLW